MCGSGSKATKAQCSARVLPKLFLGATPAAQAAAPSAAIAYDACFDEWLYTKEKMAELTSSRRKGLFRVAMVHYRDCKHLEGKKCTWPDAYNAAQAAFASRGLTNVKVDIDHVSRLAAQALPFDRKLGRATSVSLDLEYQLAWIVDHVRSKMGSVDKAFIISQMEKSLQALGPDRNPYPNGMPEGWYDRFLVRHGLESFNEVPLDVNRASSLTAENLFKAYRYLYQLAVRLGIATYNPAYKSPEETPGIEPIAWNKAEMWRIIEFDEAAFDVGIKTAETPHTSTDRQVRRKGSKNASTIRDGVPQPTFRR